ncbi:flagellar type III secretion system pore protein FliP, partial [candidate division KSB1 bacterium]|nr:flagellar type III secretion system pore protein FliP [candidate division KSB1 bacterium]
MMKKNIFTIVLFVFLVFILGNNTLFAQDKLLTLPNISFSFDEATDTGDVAISLQILALLTILSLAPAILILTTAFTRIVIIFHFIRQALGTQQMPSNQILIGLALFLTFFIMGPVWKQINDTALQPYLAEEISDTAAYAAAIKPIKRFMLETTRDKDLMLFMRFASEEKPATPEDIPLQALVPAFVVSELRIAFQIGFVIYVPFLMIDMIVASILMSMGMLMLPPIMISLPFKVLLFVLVDGWNLVSIPKVASSSWTIATSNATGTFISIYIYDNGSWDEVPDANSLDAVFIKAGNKAQDVTVNFTKSGRTGRKINQVSAFFNVSIQGPNKLVRTFKENKVRTLWRSFIWVTLPAILFWDSVKDKDWYKNIPPAHKYMNMWYEQENGDVVRIPGAHELFVLFGGLVVAGLDEEYLK